MHKQNTNSAGFTIVELLIVIVVIAILATISIVAYSGIQDRANDTAVKSDLDAMTKKIQLYYVDKSIYPIKLKPLNTDSSNTLYSFSVDQNAYDLTSGNLYYCVDSTTTPTKFLLTAVSKSGRKFYKGSDMQLGEYTGAVNWTNNAGDNICNSVSSGWTKVGQNGYFASGTGGTGTKYPVTWQWW